MQGAQQGCGGWWLMHSLPESGSMRSTLRDGQQLVHTEHALEITVAIYNAWGCVLRSNAHWPEGSYALQGVLTH